MNADEIAPYCFACEQREKHCLPPRDDIVHTQHWRAAHAFNSTLAGWLVLVPTQHITTFTGMTAEGADELGGLVRRLSIALHQVTSCAKTYLMQFSETQGFAHLHLHLVPRPRELSDDARGPAIFRYLVDDETRWLPPATRDSIALAVRAELQDRDR